MKKVIVLAIILALVVAFGGTSGSAALPMGGPAKSTPEDLPVVKLPRDLAQGPAVPTGNPHGNNPPGQTDKPDKPGKPSDDANSNKLAVVIGIADYAGSDDLWHPDEDAREMARALKRNYHYADENTKLLVNQDATADAIVSTIDWLVATENSESTVVFFFSGHGYRVSDSAGWDDDIETDGWDECIVSYDMVGLTDGDLGRMFSSLESKKITLAFGSCFSGGMFDGPGDLQGDNRVIAAACAADQYGWDYLLLGNTLWGKYFVDEALLQGAADKKGKVSIEEAHDYAYPRVVAEQPDSEPQIYDSYSGELLP